MGRYDLRPLHVHKTATQLLNAQRRSQPPPWYDTVGTIPPGQAMLKPNRPHPDQNPRWLSKKKPSRAFGPAPLAYEEDELRQDFFKDHPWELARPRLVLEDGGKEPRRWRWGKLQQPGKNLDGESVVQRQLWLMNHEDEDGNKLSKEAAYDKARKEFYNERHYEDIERRVAQEEALAVGAYFGKTALEVGMELEDRSFELWKRWAIKRAEMIQQRSEALASGTSVNTYEDADSVPATEEALLEDRVEEKKGDETKSNSTGKPPGISQRSNGPGRRQASPFSL